MVCMAARTTARRFGARERRRAVGMVGQSCAPTCTCVSCPRLRFGLLANSTTYGHTEDFVLPPTENSLLVMRAGAPCVRDRASSSIRPTTMCSSLFIVRAPLGLPRRVAHRSRTPRSHTTLHPISDRLRFLCAGPLTLRQQGSAPGSPPPPLPAPPTRWRA
jgi:hypothetical protein